MTIIRTGSDGVGVTLWKVGRKLVATVDRCVTKRDLRVLQAKGAVWVGVWMADDSATCRIPYRASVVLGVTKNGGTPTSAEFNAQMALI